MIVCGSRHFADEEPIRVALASLPPGSTVVHGACPTGADAIADRIARSLGLTVERHPADWTRRGSRAGPERNARMVAAGADLVLAFPLPGCVGTWDLVRKASAAKIEVRVYEGGEG